MSQQAKQEVLTHYRHRYSRAGRAYKSRILDEFCEMTGHDRKNAIKRMNGETRRPIYRGEGLQRLAFSSRGDSLFAETENGLVEIFPRLERPQKMCSNDRIFALIFRDWETPENEVGQLKAPDGLRFDNQRWSNHPDWIVSVSEGESQNIILHHVPTGRLRRLTQSGSADRPDLFVQ